MEPKFSRYYTYIKPVVKNKYVRTYSSFVFSLITISFFTYFALKPTISTIISLQKSINEQQDIYNKITQKRRDLETARNNYLKIPPEVKDRIFKLLPNSTSVPPLVDDLNTVAILNQATLSAIQVDETELVGEPEQITKDNTLKELNVSITATGTYSQLMGILKSLSSSNRLVKLDSVVMNKPLDGPLVMILKTKSYFYKF